MRFLIHACPVRMWYVDEFLVPSLLDQGIDPDDVEIWNDTAGEGNLYACMHSFESRTGDGGTWHLQDDVLICRDFAERCAELEKYGIVYGFCNESFTDDPEKIGLVEFKDSWHSFQCIRIPDPLARECADWFFNDARHRFIFTKWVESGKMDDSFFRAFVEDRHHDEMIFNAAPCLVEHVDALIGGSMLSQWRGYWPRAYYWHDKDLVDDLKKRIKARG